MQRWQESSVSKNQVEQNSLHGLDQINIQWSHWFCRDSCQVKDESRKSLSGLPDFWRELQWNHYDLARETNVNFTKQNSNNCQSFSKNIWMGSGNIASFFKKHEIAE